MRPVFELRLGDSATASLIPAGTYSPVPKLNCCPAVSFGVLGRLFRSAAEPPAGTCRFLNRGDPSCRRAARKFYLASGISGFSADPVSRPEASSNNCEILDRCESVIECSL